MTDAAAPTAPSPGRRITRRGFLAGIAAASTGTLVRAQGRPTYSFRQYHNQIADSPLHQRLVELWTAVRNETGGRVETTIFP